MRFHSNLTCNTTELPNSILYQPGGTVVVLSQKMTPRVIGIGKDISGLGRWTWTRLQGGNRATTEISAYRLCKLSMAEVQTVYEKHARTPSIQQES